MVKLLKEIETLASKTQEGRKQLDALWVKFGLAVREAREEQRMSLVEMAQRMGTTKSLLSYCENGKRTWNIDMAMKAVEALKRQ